MLTKYYKLGLIHEKFIVSCLWKLEVQAQGAGRDVPSQGYVGRVCPGPLSLVRGWLSSPVSLHITFPVLCLCPNLSSFEGMSHIALKSIKISSLSLITPAKALSTNTATIGSTGG